MSHVVGGVPSLVFQPPAEQLNHDPGHDLRLHTRRHQGRNRVPAFDFVDNAAFDHLGHVIPPEGVQLR